MASYSVADAKDNLPGLIVKVQAGQEVTITRYGRPVAELRPISDTARRASADMMTWIASQITDLPPLEKDPAALVRDVRDAQDW
jgi:prevent-host-death family protein